MSESQRAPVAEQTTALFDRYTLPKVALLVILAASLVGTWVTTTLSGVNAVVLSVIKWSYFVAAGVLLGGSVWKHLFVRPADLGEGASDYCADMYRRFDDIARGTIAITAGSGLVVLWDYTGYFEWGPILGYSGLLGTWLLFATVSVYRTDSVDQQFRSRLDLATLILALAVVVVTGIAEAMMRGLDPMAIGVRVLHLLAFTLWVGGAVWNIFVAVPTGQQRPTVAVVQAAGEQLERFRWTVRFIIPTLLLTGFYQAIDVFGMNVEAYVGSTVGVAVLTKVGLIVVLVIIFKLCPMWRACSPIDGVCELEELREPNTENGRPTRVESTSRGAEAGNND